MSASSHSQADQARTDGGHVVVRLVRSSIGSKPKHRGTLRALGLGRVGSTNTLPNRPEIQGMIARVRHLVTVEEGPVGEGSALNEGSETRKKAKR